MKSKKSIISLSVFLFIAISAFAQKGDYFVDKKNTAVNGYDVVAYFDGVAVKGNKGFSTEYDGINYHFSSAENLRKFKADPSKYMPEYGGYCAYAVAKTGEKVSVNPKTFELRDGKLYLFYNSWGNNTLKSWLKEDPKVLKGKADENWKKLKTN